MHDRQEETLQEYADAGPGRLQVDRSQSVIRGVKILGLRSRNGRVYLPAALESARSLYEGAKVNVNHPKGHPQGPRDYQDRIGTLRGVAFRAGAGLFADLHLNPAHALAEQLLWDAEHAPENVGLSHNVQAQTVRRGTETTVEAIVRVQGVDLVADPATTRGLFEQTSSGAQAHAPGTGESPPLSTLETTSALESWQAERETLLDELRRLRADLARHERRELARRLLCEHGLPAPESADAAARGLLGETFIESLLNAPDEGALRRLVKERAQLVASARQAGSGSLREEAAWGTGRPRSREQQQPAGYPLAIHGAGDFVRAIT